MLQGVFLEQGHLLSAVLAQQGTPLGVIQLLCHMACQWVTPPATWFHVITALKLGTSANRWVSIPRDQLHTSLTTTAVSITIRSIGPGLTALAILRIGNSPFPLLPLSHLQLFQGCDWLLPALNRTTDALYRRRLPPPPPLHTMRGTVAQSEESVLMPSRTSGRGFPRFRGAPRLACRGPEILLPSNLNTITKPRVCQGEQIRGVTASMVLVTGLFRKWRCCFLISSVVRMRCFPQIFKIPRRGICLQDVIVVV